MEGQFGEKEAGWPDKTKDGIYPSLLEVNTGRTAIACAIHSLGVHRVYAPYYYCPDIIAMLQSLDIQLCFYHIDRDFMPVDVKNEPDCAVILVNYFGVISQRLLQFANHFDKDAYEKAVSLIINAERIGASGCGHSGIFCQHFAHLMCYNFTKN